MEDKHLENSNETSSSTLEDSAASFSNSLLLRSDILDMSSESSAFVAVSPKEISLEQASLKFALDKDSIPCVAVDEQDEELEKLGVCAYDQGQFEAEVMDQVDQAIQKEEEQLHKLRLEKELKSVDGKIQLVKKRVDHLERCFKFTPDGKHLGDIARTKDVLSLKKEYDSKLKQLKQLLAKQKSLNEVISGSGVSSLSGIPGDEGSDYIQKAFSSNETEEEHLIRTGEMTPFGTFCNMQQKATAQDSVSRSTQPEYPELCKEKLKISNKPVLEQLKEGTQAVIPDNIQLVASRRPVKHVRKKTKLGSKYASGISFRPRKKTLNHNFDSDPELSDLEDGELSDDEWKPSDEECIPEHFPSEDSDQCEEVDMKKKNKVKKDPSLRKDSTKRSMPKTKKRVIDDGLHRAYAKRIKLYEKQKLMEKHKKLLESEDGIIDSDDEECVEIDSEFKVPAQLWNRLYRYQKTCVRWLWELHRQNCGGIVGDEMGLGKTIQVIVFLAGLKTSGVQVNNEQYEGLGPVLLVCPTTVMHQWVKEFHSWWPPFCVAILHESGAFVGKKDNLIATINCRNGVLITSYVGLVHHQTCLLKYDWHYIILDEGHKIRNPDAQATLVAKQVRTTHRLILSGSPIQNNLKELWSLFDFIFPGKLGTLPVFMQQFAVPIVQGGYANASQFQVQTAYKCATVLRDTIKPYLLRRTKADVKMTINLPNKNEQVLFCKLADEQVELYKDYLASPEVKSILNARLQVFVGLIHLRKICNHPDLYTGGPKVFKDTDLSSLSDDMHYGYYKRAGKMIVVDALLRLWQKQGHRVLLFTQSRQMMEILEIFVKRREYTYMKMDGSTSVASRQPAIEKFNSDPSIFVFLLTTRVGGIGVNLTGANRIIIYDPDWNPSTDAQAKERSWRIGQERQVTIYRLLTAGTIEEKIYHRQIFKQFVTNRVLRDPRQRRFFKSNDLYELFTFSDMGKEGTETSAIFAGTGSEVKHIPQCKPSAKRSSSIPSSKDIKASFSADKIAKMKEQARKLSLQLLTKPQGSKTQDPPITATAQGPSSSHASPKQSSKHVGKNQSGKNASHSSKLNCSHKSDKNKTVPNPVNKHRKRKRKKVAVDGKEIDYLVKKDTFNPNNEEDDSKKDDYVLSKLFKKSGVHTALRHDVIVEASDPDYLLVEEEANRVAQEAVKALRQSRRQCAAATEGIPTWTGSSGGLKPRFGLKKAMPVLGKMSAREENKPGTSKLPIKLPCSGKQSASGDHEKNIPLSSSDLLDSIRATNMLSTQNSDSDSELEGPVLSSRQISTETELLDDIRSFVAFRAAADGQATTAELLQEFQPKLPIKLTAVFRALLRKICDFSRTTAGDGLWTLKPEFR